MNSIPRGADLSGLTFSRLTVEGLHSQQGYIKRYTCLCVCGNRCTVTREGLMKGSTKSCGCLRVETTVARSTVHGQYYTPEYRVYTSMVNRCTNPNYLEYHLYGGRGIKVSPEFDSFEKFISHVGKRPSKGYQLDRENNEGDYEPKNVKWVTKEVNARNKRNTIFVEFRGVVMSLPEAAEKAGLNYHALYYRYSSGDRGDYLFRPSQKY